MNNLLNNIPPITKNLLILNVLFFLATFLAERQQIDLKSLCAVYPLNDPAFRPYQIVTHFFMHAGFFHLLGNMLGLVVFGSALERVWPPKRYAFFYIACAMGAFALHMGLETYKLSLGEQTSGMLGASGAIYGLSVGYAMLFPNTELMLLFPPIPIKAKYLVGGLVVIALYLAIKDDPSAQVAHAAHLGGALVGCILVLIWKRNKSSFY